MTCVAIGTDPEDVIRNAFACFDEEGTGKIHEDRLRELLTTMGDRFNDAEVSVVVSFIPARVGVTGGRQVSCKLSQQLCLVLPPCTIKG